MSNITTKTASCVDADLTDTAQTIQELLSPAEAAGFSIYVNVTIAATGTGAVKVASKQRNSPAVVDGDWITIAAGSSETFSQLDIANSLIKAAVNGDTNTINFIGDPE